MALGIDTGVDFDRARRGETLQYRLLYVFAWTVFLALALGARLVPWRAGAEAGPRRSCFAEARARAAATVPFAFMI